MGRPVSASSAASFHAHQLPRDQPLESVAEEFATWWVERSEAEQLAAPHVDFAREVLRSGLAPKPRGALLAELLLNLPFDLLWKAPALLQMAGSDTEVVEALRGLASSWQFNARYHVVAWLIERNALGVEELDRLLEDSSLRLSVATALERFSAEALRPLSAEIARLAAAEKHRHTRAALAKLARKARGRMKAGAVEQLDAAALAAHIQTEWDADHDRAVSRRLLQGLAEMADGSGLVQLLILRQRARSRSLREACAALLESAGASPDIDAALTAQLLRVPAGPERKTIERLVAARLEEAMVAARALVGERLVAQLAAIGPRRALVVRSAPDGEPWFLTAETSPPPSSVWLVHPASVTEDALEALFRRAKSDELSIPCDQLVRPAFRLVPHQRSEKRFELDVPSPRHPRRLLANGWRPAYCESYDPDDSNYKSFSESTKLFASAGVEARWEHAPMYPSSPEDEEPDNDEWLTFWNTTQPPQQLELGQVPPIVFSELLHELTPKDARSRAATRRSPPVMGRAHAKAAPASKTACADEILALASRLGRSPERRADALRLVEALDQRAQDLIQAFTTGEARSDADACALLGLTPGELMGLTELIRRTFAPVLQS